ncbi:MAG: glycosyltransferase family 4 protein [Acidobacteria bacterium]|nr:glycosyltransferase family 4 protein [Acidobacteriota bacterium]
MRLLFITATPLNIVEGSGTFAGIHLLARSLEHLGVQVDFATPGERIGNFTLRRLWFNESLRRRALDYDAVVGFDMDGYRMAAGGGVPHVASIKGIIADEMRFERGLTRFSMAMQSACEGRHARRATAVMTTSEYAARRLCELYGIDKPVAIVPELIDLAGWRQLFHANPAAPDPARFTVLTVCRFYPRKRLHLLLEAASSLQANVPGIEFRIVGGGPQFPRLLQLWREKRLQDTVTWLGDLSQASLAAEYNRCHAFCLPSVQEGFGIVFLEAMAAGKPIVAARAAAVPEVVPQGLLVEPEDAGAIASALLRLQRDLTLRAALADQGRAIVERFDAPRVARAFLDQLKRIVRSQA